MKKKASKAENLQIENLQLPPEGVVQIPLSKVSPQSQAFQGSGPGEMLALLAGKIPEKNVQQALSLTEKRLENDEKERTR